MTEVKIQYPHIALGSCPRITPKPIKLVRREKVEYGADAFQNLQDFAASQGLKKLAPKVISFFQQHAIFRLNFEARQLNSQKRQDNFVECAPSDLLAGIKQSQETPIVRPALLTAYLSGFPEEARSALAQKYYRSELVGHLIENLPLKLLSHAPWSREPSEQVIGAVLAEEREQRPDFQAELDQKYKLAMTYGWSLPNCFWALKMPRGGGMLGLGVVRFNDGREKFQFALRDDLFLELLPVAEKILALGEQAGLPPSAFGLRDGT